MNDTQNTRSTDGLVAPQSQGDLQPTGTQNLSAPQSDLQNTNQPALNQQGLKITSVGSSNFTPVTGQTVASNGLTPNTAPGSSLPLVFGIGLALVILIGLAIWAIKNSNRASSITDENSSDSAKLVTETAYVKTRKRAKQPRSKRKRSRAAR